MGEPTTKSPENQVGVVIRSPIVLTRNDDVATVLHFLLGYPDGIATELGIHLREPLGNRDWLEALYDEGHDGRFRIAFGFNQPIDPLPFRTPLGSHRPVWYSEGGSGSDISYQARLWISPYPPEGSLVVSCAWPERGIAVASSRLEVPSLEQVEEQTVPLW